MSGIDTWLDDSERTEAQDYGYEYVGATNPSAIIDNIGSATRVMALEGIAA